MRYNEQAIEIWQKNHLKSFLYNKKRGCWK